jgi:hypothetical protein
VVPEQLDGTSALDVLSRAMSLPHFPVRPDELPGEWTFASVAPGEHDFEGFTVTVREIPHRRRASTPSKSGVAAPWPGLCCSTTGPTAPTISSTSSRVATRPRRRRRSPPKRWSSISSAGGSWSLSAARCTESFGTGSGPHGIRLGPTRDWSAYEPLTNPGRRCHRPFHDLRRERQLSRWLRGSALITVPASPRGWFGLTVPRVSV